MKKTFSIIVSMIIIIIFTIFSVSAFSSSLPWHPLGQVSNAAGTASVDADNDGLIDVAERANDVICSNCISSSEITDSQVFSNDIMDGQIFSIDIRDGTVTSTDISDGTITSNDVANSAITSIKILDGTITSNDVANNAITSIKILDGTITSSDIADGTITSSDINADSIQSRVTGTCPSGSSISSISNTGIVTCETDDVGTNYWLPSGSNIYFPDTGNVGIRKTPSFALDVMGTVRATSFVYDSDIRLKKNINKITDPIATVQQLEGVKFRWKENNIASIGLIAQDVEKVFPELVHTDNTGIKSVEYGNLVAVLIEAVKEQQKEIDDLKKEIENLRS